MAQGFAVEVLGEWRATAEALEEAEAQEEAWAQEETGATRLNKPGAKALSLGRAGARPQSLVEHKMETVLQASDYSPCISLLFSFSVLF